MAIADSCCLFARVCVCVSCTLQGPVSARRPPGRGAPEPVGLPLHHRGGAAGAGVRLSGTQRRALLLL